MADIISVVWGGMRFLIELVFKRKQRRNDEINLRLEAYPKRVAVFKSTQEFLSRAWTDKHASMQALSAKFLHGTSEARFLFGNELGDYLDSLYEGVDRHFHLETKLEIQGDSLVGAEKLALQEKVFSSRYWISQQNRQLPKRFAKHLDISAIR